MIKKILFAIGITCLLSACNQQSGNLLENKWDFSGNASIENKELTISGKEGKAILENGNYKDFELTMELKTEPGAKGAICFHTDNSLGKGYRIAINNNTNDKIWWKMSGSLESVRNLTKSFVKENEWFNLQVTVLGKEITVNINGTPVVKYIEPTKPFRTEAFKNRLLSEGTFALISQSDKKIYCRNMTVNKLEANIDEAEQQRQAIDEQTDEIIRLHQEDFPALDYHVHLKGGLTKEHAAKQSLRLGINYVIAPNYGIGFPIQTNEDITAYLDTMRMQPFILAMQAEGREWLTTFSPEVRKEFDFVFTDALTFTDDKGRRTRLWIPEEVWIDGNEEKYMDLIVNRICDVLKEPVDVYVNPCFLPTPMDKQYDKFWTDARINKFITALKESGKALEINELYQIPSKRIILAAKEAGIKFTFGSNNITPDVSDLSYCIRMKKECGLTADDMYKPKIKL